ncbi:hypothetical protein [Komagataeibacter europaeus]|uniref:hypothetical protein n=1 Tax=Komagataeibacter europaeus TaxID=33995 RepID=UPI0013A07E00|nr:hypothetical protein [Komagataeibacter europaeus]
MTVGQAEYRFSHYHNAIFMKLSQIFPDKIFYTATVFFDDPERGEEAVDGKLVTTSAGLVTPVPPRTYADAQT